MKHTVIKNNLNYQETADYFFKILFTDAYEIFILIVKILQINELSEGCKKLIRKMDVKYIRTT